MQDIGLLSQFIHEYGPLVVILAVFLSIFITIIVYILRMNKKSADDNAELNSQLVTSILNEYFKKNSDMFTSHKKYNEKNIVDIFMELNKVLKTSCEHTMKKTNSDRTAIYVFHNGSHASHGLPFFKITCICETISKNSNANIKIAEHTSIPLNVFDSIITNLYNNSEYRIISNETEDPTEIIFLKNTKIQDCFFEPIYDDDNSMMGFVFNGYNNIDESRDIDMEKKCLVELAKMSKPVIEYSKFQEYQDDKEE